MTLRRREEPSFDVDSYIVVSACYDYTTDIASISMLLNGTLFGYFILNTILDVAKGRKGYHVSQTSAGSTSLIIFQCSKALRSRYLYIRPDSLAINIGLPRCSISANREASSSCFGVKNVSRALLPRKSCDTGSRKLNGVALLFLQKTTMLVKSCCICGVAGASSRKIRHVGKTAWMVRTARPAG